MPSAASGANTVAAEAATVFHQGDRGAAYRDPETGAWHDVEVLRGLCDVPGPIWVQEDERHGGRRRRVALPQGQPLAILRRKRDLATVRLMPDWTYQVVG